MARHIHVLPPQELLRRVEEAGVSPEALEGRGQPGGLVQEDGRALELPLEGVHPVFLGVCVRGGGPGCVCGVFLGFEASLSAGGRFGSNKRESTHTTQKSRTHR